MVEERVKKGNDGGERMGGSEGKGGKGWGKEKINKGVCVILQNEEEED